MADLGIEVNLLPKVDTSKLMDALKGVSAQIPLEVNKTALQSSINNAIKSINTNKIRLGVDKAYLSAQVKQALSATNLSLPSTVKSSSKTAGADSSPAVMSAKQISAAQRQMYKWEQSVTRMQKSGIYSKSATKSFNQQLAQIKQMKTGTEQWASAYEKLNFQFTKAQEIQRNMIQQQKIQETAQNSAQQALTQQAAYENQLAKMQASISRARISGYSDPLMEDTDQQIQAIRSMTAGTDQYRDAMLRLRQSYTDFNEAYKTFRQNKTLDTAELRNQEHLNNLYRQASELLRNNPRVQGTLIQSSLERIMQQSLTSDSDYVSLSRDLASARAQMEELGLTTETVGARLKRLFGDHMNTAIAMAGLHALQYTFQELLQNVIDVDSAMTDLQKVSNATAQEYDAFLAGTTARAKELGSTVTDVVGATAEFSRLGYSLDQSSVLGDAAVKYLNVSEYTNIEDAAQSIVSTMQAFGIEAENVGDIVDKFNEIGNNYAISSQGLGEAMQRSAASLSLAGNTLDESLALVTAANEVVQDPDVVGTWAKTLTMYLRAAKTEAEEAGVETEGMANSVSELRDSIMKLTGNRVDIMQDDSTFKSTVQIMREIASVYDTMSDVDQAALLELLSGKRQANTTAALISNWETVEKAIISSQNAFGSADKENEKFINSIEGRLAQFQAQFESTSVSVLDSGLVKGAVNTGTGLLGAVQWLTDTLGTIPGLIAPILSMIASMNNVNLFRTQMNADGTTSLTNIFSEITKKSQAFSAQLAKDQSILQNYFSAGANLSGNDLLRQMNGASNAAIDFAQAIDVTGMSAEHAQQKIDFFVKSQQNGAKISVQFANALKGIGASVMSMAALAAISFAIQEIVKTVDSMVLSASEAAEVTANVTQEFTTNSEALKENISTVESLQDRFKELSRGVSENGKNVSLTTSEYDEYLDIVSQLSDMNPALIKGYNDQNQAIIDKNNAIQDTIALLKQQRIEEASNTVYGGRGENDGGKTNLEAAFINFEDEYEKQKDNIARTAGDIAGFISGIYNEAIEKGTGEQVQSALEQISGMTVEQLDGIDYQRDVYGLIAKNERQLAENLPELISLFDQYGLVSTDAVREASDLSSEFVTQSNNIESTASSLRTMIQAIYESQEAYYDLSDEQISFLDMFRTNLSAEDLIGMDDADLNAMITSLIESMSDSDVQAAVKKMYDLLADKDSVPADEFISQGKEISSALASGIGMEDIDFYSLLGFDDFEADARDISGTVASNFQKAFDGVQIDGSSVEQLSSKINFDNLSLGQLTMMNDLLTESGDRTVEFAARMSALAEVNELGTVLDQVTNAVDDQAISFYTVSDAISDYNAAVDGLVDGADTHESMVDIYDEFAESVNKGQINTETAREQMELLIGKVVSLEEAKKWVSENQGLFLTGLDEDAIGQDLTGIFNTLESKYNQLSDEQRAVADSLMDVDWDTGSIKVAQADVVALADAFGMSAASLQQALDLIASYSDYTPPTVATMSKNISTLNQAASSLSQSVGEAERSTTTAWEKMTESQRVAMEELTQGMDIDVKSMSTQDVMELASSFAKLQASLGETPSSESLTTFFSDLKTAAGDAAAEITRLDDGSWTIDVTNIEAAAAAFNTTEEGAKILLNAISQLQDDSQNPITVTVNGESIQPELDAASGYFDEFASAMEKEYNIKVNTTQAETNIDSISGKLRNIPRTVTVSIKTVSTGFTLLPGAGEGGGGGNPINDSGYAGIPGKMASMAGGGRSTGGRTLVGELGRELWISRDGKRQKIVGKNGMEVITMRRGDAIVPNNITESLIRGGMSQAANGLWSGANSSGALSNLNFATGGDYTNWSAAANAAEKVASAAQSATSATDSLEDQLSELKEAFDKVLNTFEHSIFLLDETKGPVEEIVAIYKKAQDAVHAQAEKYRAMGASENSEYIQELQKKWFEYRNAIVDAMTNAYDKILSEQKNSITLIENWQDNAIDAGSLILVERYANDIIAKYKAMQETLHDQAEYYRSIGYSDTSDEVSELSDLWWDYQAEIKDVKQAVIDNLMDMVDQTSEALGELQSVYDTFHSAADEYAENGGFISIDSYRDIIDMGPQYLQFLQDENGLLTINEESINRVIAAKAEQLALDSAMSYIERLRLAMQKDSLEDLNQLLGLTLESTDATWGMVYANLALLDLGSEQYQAALHNINALRAVADSAANGIGKVSNELTDMRSGMEDFLQYVMDMLEQQVRNQIEDLEDLKESYAELIQLKKDSLEASREETDYQDDVADRVKEIAKLQQQINALSLDDSRDAQAQRLALEEQMAELQKELADAQADYAYETQVDSLDKMQEAYEDQKDAEIEKLENSISSQQKLYDMAISYIESNWNTLYDELIAWNYEYGTSLSTEIGSAWNSAIEAAKRYGSFVAAMDATTGISSSGGSDSGSNGVVGDTQYGNDYSNEDMISAIVQQMYRNSQAWHNASESERKRLDAENASRAAELARYGVTAVRDNKSGVWYVDYIGGTKLYDRYLKYHTGGIAGNQPTLRQKEMLAVLETGEAILDKEKQDSLMQTLDLVKALSSGISQTVSAAELMDTFGRSSITSDTNSLATSPALKQIHFGDVHICGADGDTVQQHIEINRRFANDIINLLNIKK